MERTFEVRKIAEDTIEAILSATNKVVSRYDASGKIKEVVDNFNLPPEAYVKQIATNL